MEGNAPESDREVLDESADSTSLRGGQLLSAISTGIVQLMREHYGRGPVKAKTYALDDLVVCVLRGSGFTPLEQTMMASGDSDRVVEMREEFQDIMARRYRELVERLTGRKVLAFLSQAQVEPEITLEVFFLDRPVENFGAVEMLGPPRGKDKPGGTGFPGTLEFAVGWA